MCDSEFIFHIMRSQYWWINAITVTYYVVYRAGTTAQRRRRWHSTVAMRIHPYEGTVTSVLQMDHTICYHIRVGGVGLGVDHPLYVHTWEKWISGLNQAPFFALLLTVRLPVQQRESQRWFHFFSFPEVPHRERTCTFPPFNEAITGWWRCWDFN